MPRIDFRRSKRDSSRLVGPPQLGLFEFLSRGNILQSSLFTRIRQNDVSLRPPSTPAPYLSTIVAFVLIVLGPIIIISATPNTSTSNNFEGPLLIAGLAGLRLSVIVGSRRRRIFEMVVWLYVYVFLGIASMIQMRLNADTDTTPGVNHYLDWETSAVVLTGAIAFLIGVVALRKSKLEPVRDAPTVSQARTNLLTLVSLALFAFYASRIGFGNLFRSRLEMDILKSVAWPNSTTAALIVGVTSMGLLASTIAQINLRRQRKIAGYSQPLVLPLASLIALVVCVNPVGSARYSYGTVYLALIGAVGAYATVKRFRLVTLGAVFGMIYLFPIADMFRRSLDPNIKSQNPLQSMLSGDFDSFSQITNTIDYVSSNGITWGQQLLGVLFFWVPRSIWPDKALDTGTLIGAWKFYNFKNLSAPLWAELYINGGWILLVVGMFLLGVAIGRLDRKSEQRLSITRQPSVLVAILPFYLLIVLRGSLLQSVASMAVILLASAFVSTARPVGEKQPSFRVPH